ncbi:MAG: hypothetical protein L0206_24015, partial [Actinobacteria bacterium]|nr:hypothetical protein [Actinomycetota bacterium]
DPAGRVQASIYLSLDMHSWAVGNGYGTNCVYPHPDDVPCVYPYWGWDPGAQPDFVVDATLYMAQLGEHGANASDAPPILDAIESGTAEIVAQGRVGPATVMNGIPGSAAANQFVVDLGTPQVSAIPRDKSFFMVYSFYSESPAGPVGVNSWRIWSGELFPPMFSLPVKNAFDVERVIPNFAHGKLAILGVMNTPWGSYDISPNTVRLDIAREGAEVSPERIQRFGEFSVAHGGHYLPINVTWIWDFNGDHARPGQYEVTLSAANHQLSARAICTASFDLVLVRDELRPRDVAEGVCGQQTASDEFIEDIRSGSEQSGGGT